MSPHPSESLPTRLYQDCRVGDHAQAHFGDYHTHHHHLAHVNTAAPSGQSRTTVPDAVPSILTNYLESSDTFLRQYRTALFTTDPRVDRDAIKYARGERVLGTCQWIQSNAIYEVWFRGKNPLLWISGSPGKGKTFLSVFITRELERDCKVRPDAGIIYAFCSAGHPRRSSAAHILRSLIYQILGQYPTTLNTVFEHFESQQILRDSLASREALWNCFVSIAQSIAMSHLYCVLDGLDECDEDSTLWLARRFTQHAKGLDPDQTQLKVLIASRDHPILRSWPTIALDAAHTQDVAKDIQTVVSAYIDEHLQTAAFDSRFRDTVKERLVNGAQGTFLWLGLAIAELSSKTSRAAILECLARLPQGLPAIYDRILASINDQHIDVCSRLLLWVSLSTRHLTVPDLAYALDVGSTALLDKTALVEHYIQCCGSLLNKQQRYVYLVHHSAREHLLSKVGDALFDPGTAEATIASRCVDRLETTFAEHGTTVDLPLTGNEALLRTQPLLDYAFNHLRDHLKNMPENSYGVIMHKSGFFYGASPIRELISLHGACPDTRYTKQRFICNTDPLFPACLLEVPAWIKVLLDRDQSKPGIDGPIAKGNALRNAARQGQYSILKLLLDYDLEVDARLEPTGFTALMFAAHHGSEVCVALLLKHGAAVNASDEQGQTALSLAVNRSSNRVIRTLLEAGADIPAMTGHPSPILMEAIESGNLDSVSLLLQFGATIGASGHNNALAMACGLGFAAIVRLLLDKGADVNGSSGKDRVTPLEMAVKYKRPRVAQYLIEHGAHHEHVRRDFRDHFCCDDLPMIEIDERPVPKQSLDEALVSNLALGVPWWWWSDSSWIYERVYKRPRMRRRVRAKDGHRNASAE